mmetsp:Transcript_759/g.2636  ORF Transcript_759/g.2636 Transcript_759/m.2636 type:complete len:255 (-) Transcript_759:264-1028(-)
MVGMPVCLAVRLGAAARPGSRRCAERVVLAADRIERMLVVPCRDARDARGRGRCLRNVRHCRRIAGPSRINGHHRRRQLDQRWAIGTEAAIFGALQHEAVGRRNATPRVGWRRLCRFDLCHPLAHALDGRVDGGGGLAIGVELVRVAVDAVAHAADDDVDREVGAPGEVARLVGHGAVARRARLAHPCGCVRDGGVGVVRRRFGRRAEGSTRSGCRPAAFVRGGDDRWQRGAAGRRWRRVHRRVRHAVGRMVRV